MHINSWKVKFILIGTVMLYGIMLIVFLIRNSDSKRFVTIESNRQGGVVLINDIKYKTHYIKQQVRIVYKIDNLNDYLFLNSDTQQECYVTALLELIIALLLAAFIWRFDFNYPFKAAYLNRGKVIFGLTIVVVILKWFADMYTSSWIGQHLNSSDINGEHYSYQSISSSYIALFIVVATVVLYFTVKL